MRKRQCGQRSCLELDMQPAPPAPGRGKWFLFGQIVFGCCKCSEGGRLWQNAKVLSDPLCGQNILGGWKGGNMFAIRQSRGCSDIQSVNLITDKMGLTATLPPGFTPPGLLMSLLNCECWQPVPMLNNLLYWCLSWSINCSGAQVLRSEYLRLVFASVRNLFNVLFAF